MRTASRTKVLLLALAPLSLASACGSNSSPGDPFGGGGATSAGGASTAGAAGTSAGGEGTFAAGGSAGAAACKKTAETCALSSDCCGSAVCNTNTPATELLGCQPACNTAADCPSGCCMPYGGQTHGFCADAKWCACGADGSRCGSMLPACCDTHVCLAGDTAATFFACKKRCTQNTDCSTSCCVAIPGTNTSACLDPTYCGM